MKKRFPPKRCLQGSPVGTAEQPWKFGLRSERKHTLIALLRGGTRIVLWLRRHWMKNLRRRFRFWAVSLALARQPIVSTAAELKC